MKNVLLSFGHGYSAAALARRLLPLGWRVIGTTRSAETAVQLRDSGVEPVIWDSEDVFAALDQATYVLSSVSPENGADPVLKRFGDALSLRARDLRWVGYLSTTGVYGNHDGAWVNEETAPTPGSDRSLDRILAEQAWAEIPDVPLHIFRLAGIYGPRRGPFGKVRQGNARRIIKPGQVFSRIHVADIALVLQASMNKPFPGRVYNVCDNDPAPPQDVIAHAAELLGLPVPPAVSFEQADLSPMARSFYADNKRVSNARIKDELGVTLQYPDYRSGLAAVLHAERGQA